MPRVWERHPGRKGRVWRCEKVRLLMHSPVQAQKYSTQSQIPEENHQADPKALMSALHVRAPWQAENSKVFDISINDLPCKTVRVSRR